MCVAGLGPAAAQSVGDTPDSVRASLQMFLHAEMRIQRWADGVNDDAPPTRAGLVPALRADAVPGSSGSRLSLMGVS